MCEPISMAIAAACICCCCVIPLVVLLVAMPTIMAVVNAMKEILLCANETLAPGYLEAMETDNCTKMKEAGCMDEEDEQHDMGVVGMRSKPPASDKCKALQGMCMCEVVGIFAKLEPGLDERLGGCCSTLEDQEGTPGVGEMAHEAAKVCHGVIHNMTKSMHEANHNCSKGLLPDSAGGLMPQMPEEFAQKFSVVADVYPRAPHALQPVAIFGGAALLVAGVAMVLRRRSSVGSSRFQAVSLKRVQADEFDGLID